TVLIERAEVAAGQRISSFARALVQRRSAGQVLGHPLAAVVQDGQLRTPPRVPGLARLGVQLTCPLEVLGHAATVDVEARQAGAGPRAPPLASALEVLPRALAVLGHAHPLVERKAHPSARVLVAALARGHRELEGARA